MNLALPAGMRIEVGRPIRLDTSGPPIWMCIGKLKGHRSGRYGESRLPSLAGGGAGADESVTETLFIAKANGADPDEAIRNATDQLIRFGSTRPPVFSEDTPTPRLRGLPVTVPPMARTRARWWLSRAWKWLRRS